MKFSGTVSILVLLATVALCMPTEKKSTYTYEGELFDHYNASSLPKEFDDDMKNHKSFTYEFMTWYYMAMLSVTASKVLPNPPVDPTKGVVANLTQDLRNEHKNDVENLFVSFVLEVPNKDLKEPPTPDHLKEVMYAEAKRNGLKQWNITSLSYVDQ